MKILVTAFDAFGTDTLNPTAEVLNLISDEIQITHTQTDAVCTFNPHIQSKSISVVKLLLPVSYNRAAYIISKALITHSPDYVLCLGFAASRDCVTPEAIAINVKSSSRPDNDGVVANGERISQNGENAYFSGIDTVALSAHISSIGIPCQVSYHAGTYVCNSTYYTVLSKHPKACFIHVPNDEYSVKSRPEGTPYLKREDILRAVIEGIRFIADIYS